MTDSSSNRSFLTATLIAVCAFSVILAISLYGYLKSAEQKFKKDKAVLVREKMELKDELDELKDDLKEKADAVTSLQTERKAIKEELIRLEKLNEELSSARNDEVEGLKKEIARLRRDTEQYRDVAPLDLIRGMIGREKDENIRQILSDAMTRIGMVKEGRQVTLEPIVVTGAAAGSASSPGKKEAKILTLDKKNSLIVINLGQGQGVKEGQRVTISDNGSEIAFATIIRTRYEISAAFVDSFSGRHTIQDVTEKAKIVVE